MQLSKPTAATGTDVTAVPAPNVMATIDAGPTGDAALSMAACGPSLARALERAAVRDLEASRRATYHAQDAEDRTRIEHLRAERNAEVDWLDEQARLVNVERELELSAQRVAWIDANAVAVEKRREARRAVRASRQSDAPLRRAYLEELRHDHAEQIDQLDKELKTLRVSHALAEARLRAPWLDAVERARVAKRAMKVALRELHAQESAERPQRVAEQDAARRERTEASEARWAAAHKATAEHAVMQAEIREAQRTGEGDLTALRAREAELRAQARTLEHEARTSDLAAANDLFEQCRADGAARALTQANLREEWLSARHEANVERLKARDAVRAFRAASRQEMLAAEAHIRARRNEVNEHYQQAVDEVYTSWGLNEAELRREALDASAHAHRLKLVAEQENRELVRQGRADEAARLEDIRKRKVAAYSAFEQAILDIRTKRGVARAEEREHARVTALEVYARYRAELAGA